MVFLGFNDWQNVDFRQIGARLGGAGSSGSGTIPDAIGGGIPGDSIGGGVPGDAIGGGVPGDAIGGGTIPDAIGGGEVDYDLANSTVDAPNGLSATIGNKVVNLAWNQPGFGQIRDYVIHRLTGTVSNTNPLTNAQPIATVKGPGTPPNGEPTTTYTDSTAKNNTTYTYFVLSQLADGRQSGPSNLAVISVEF